MKIYKKTPEKLSFSVEIEESLANAIRRSVQEIPTLAVDEVEIIQNDSVIYDEVLAHRIGLIPLKMDGTMHEKNKKGKKDEGMLFEAKLKLSKKGPCTIYSGDLSGGTEVVYKNMPLTLLRKNQEIELVATAVLGKGIEHVKYSPGILFYREFYEASPKKGKNINKEFLEEFSNTIITPDTEGEELEFEMYKLQNGKTIGEAYSEFKEDITVNKGTGLMFFIESFGQMEAEEILKNAVEALKKNLDHFIQEN